VAMRLAMSGVFRVSCSSSAAADRLTCGLRESVRAFTAGSSTWDAATCMLAKAHIVTPFNFNTQHVTTTTRRSALTMLQ
jgi:hypothetical protein